MDNCEPTTTGGNTNIRNGDEREALEDCVLIPARTEGAQEGDFH